MGDVLINRTEQTPDGLVVYYTIPGLSVDSQLQMTNDQYIDEIQSGGFIALGQYILKQLDIGIQGLIKDGE